jgi:cyanophycin synthetase
VADASPRPDPAAEIRLLSLHGTRGASYWSTRPVTRMDLAVGAYDDISSADVPGVTERLLGAMPGLAEHECSLGERGGFVVRLRRGTYAPHIVEHVALELQTAIGHEVGYGRTRGGDAPGEYTLVFEHHHEQVGLRAAALALDAVQRAFAGTLESVEGAVAELAALARTASSPPIEQRVSCGITGGALRAETRSEIVRRGAGADSLVVDVAPAFLLQQGLPYRRSSAAIILDAEPVDVPERYRDPERARRLVSVLVDAVPRRGVVIVPAKEWELQDAAREAECRVAIFSPDGDITPRDRKVAHLVGTVQGGRIVVESPEETSDEGALLPDAPAASQVAGALAALVLRSHDRWRDDELAAD